MTDHDFIQSLSNQSPPKDFNLYWEALWHIYKGDWQSAHDIVDGPPGELFAWMHAVVHQIEGDDWNANYWYRKAGRGALGYDLESEKRKLFEYLLANR